MLRVGDRAHKEVEEESQVGQRCIRELGDPLLPPLSLPFCILFPAAFTQPRQSFRCPLWKQGWQL